MNILTIIISFAVGFGVAWFLKRPRSASSDGLVNQQMRDKSDNLQKVKELFSQQEKVTNDDVEKLLGVSNATSERYLDELEKSGFVRQVGNTGAGVYYEKI